MRSGIAVTVVVGTALGAGLWPLGARPARSAAAVRAQAPSGFRADGTYPGDGWFALPRPPVRVEAVDVAGLADGSVVVADLDAPVLRLDRSGWKRIGGLRATGLTPTADGAVLATSPSEDAVLRWRPGAPAEVVAGGRAGFGGDGGPAVGAALSLVESDPVTGDVALTPDGGVLIPDGGNHRVRRVDAAGTIGTVAGSGRRGDRAEGSPAVGFRLGVPMTVVAQPDGGFAIAEGDPGRVRRVAPDGTIATLLRARSYVTDIAPGPAGLIVAGYPHNWLLAPDGRTRPWAPPADFALRTAGCVEHLGVDPAGGLLTVGCRDRLWYRPAAPPQLPLVALRDTRIGPDGVRAVFESTAAGTATLRVEPRGGAAAEVSQAVAAGHSMLARRARLHDGWYRVGVTLTTADGATARDAVWLFVTRRLTKRQTIKLLGGRVQSADVGEITRLSGRCRAFGARRVDCERRLLADTGRRIRNSCLDVLSLRRRTTGVVVRRSYPCGHPLFRRHARPAQDDEFSGPVTP